MAKKKEPMTHKRADWLVTACGLMHLPILPGGPPFYAIRVRWKDVRCQNCLRTKDA